MKNLENYGVLEMNAKELQSIDGGVIPWAAIVAATVAVGAAMEWAFEKGEELGKALA